MPLQWRRYSAVDMTSTAYGKHLFGFQEAFGLALLKASCITKSDSCVTKAFFLDSVSTPVRFDDRLSSLFDLASGWLRRLLMAQSSAGRLGSHRLW